MAKSLFSSSKIALVLSLGLTAIGFFFFRFEPIVLGLLVGAAVSTSLCMYPERAIIGSITIQTILILLASMGCSVGLLYIFAVLMVLSSEYIEKNPSRFSVIMSTIVTIFVCLMGVAAGAGANLLIERL